MLKTFGKKYKRVIAILMAVAIVITLVPFSNKNLSNVTAGSASLNAAVEESSKKLANTVDAFSYENEKLYLDQAKSTKGQFKKILKAAYDGGLVDIAFNIANGTKSGSISSSGVSINFSDLNKVNVAKSMIETYLGAGSLSSLLSLTETNTGVIVTLKNNLGFLGKIFTVNGMTPSEKWNQIAANTDEGEETNKNKKEIAKKFIEEMESNAEIKKDFKISINYDGDDIDISAEPKQYTVTFDINKDKTEIDYVDYETTLETVIEKNHISAENTKDGYEFTGWDVDTDIEITKDITVTAQYKAIPVPYTIEVYYQNLSGNYDDVEPEIISGDEIKANTDSKLKENIDDIQTKISKKTGFTFDSDNTLTEDSKEVEVKADGSTVYKVYYKRNMPELTLRMEEIGEDLTYDVLFGQTVHITGQELKDRLEDKNDKLYDWSFYGWIDDENVFQGGTEIVMPDKDVLLRAILVPKSQEFIIKMSDNSVPQQPKIIEDEEDETNEPLWYKDDIKIEANTEGEQNFENDFTVTSTTNESLEYKEEGTYSKQNVTVTSKKENTYIPTMEKKYTLSTFGIDKTKPDFDLKYENEENNSKDGVWTNNDNQANIVISDIKDIKPEGVNSISEVKTITVKIGNDDPIIFDYAENVENDINDILKWEELSEGNYEVKVVVTDNAGNSKEKVINVKKDTTNPNFVLKYEKDDVWTKKETNITVTDIQDSTKNATDVSGIKNVTVKIDGEEYPSQDSAEDITIPWSALKEGKYDVEVTVTDNAGNSTPDTVTVMKDTTDPDFVLKYEKDGVWTKEETNITVTDIQDSTKNATDVSDIKKVNVKGKGIEGIVKNQTEDVKDPIIIPWNDIKEGNYDVTVTVTDVAGNEKTEKVTIMKDTTKPKGSLTLNSDEKDNPSWKQDNEKLTFTSLVESIKELYSRKVVKFSATYEDVENNNIKPVFDNGRDNEAISHGVEAYYYIYDAKKKNLTQYDDLNSVDENKWEYYDKDDDYTKLVEVFASDYYQVYFKFVDAAGNVKYISSDHITIDNVKPVPKIDITELTDPVNGYYSGNVDLNINVREPQPDGDYSKNVYSGLQSVKYKIVNCDEKNNPIKTVVEKEYNSNNTKSGYEKDLSRFSKDITVNAKDCNFNNVKVIVTAIDKSGNSDTASKTLKIDISRPIISVSYDNAEHEGKYFRQKRVATITVAERNFDKRLIEINATKNGSKMSVSGNSLSWSTVKGSSANGDDTKHVAKIEYAQDGDYTFSISGKDKADNQSRANQTTYSPDAFAKEFTIDLTKPVVDVSYSIQPSSGKYYNAPVTITVKINEHNFNASDVKLTTKGASTVGGFSSSGDNHTASFIYSIDGDCEFDIEYTDLAGNRAVYNGKSGNNQSDLTLDEFVIDQTKPESIKFDTKNLTANKGKASATFTFEDAYFYDGQYALANRKDGIKIRIDGYKNGDVTRDFPYSLTVDDNGKIRAQFGDFPKQIQWDDVYTISVTVTDLAGNESDPSRIIFSVNRFGSNYVLRDTTEQLVESYYTNQKPTVEVFEISASVDYVKDYSISTLINGENNKLDKSKFDVDHNWSVLYPDDYNVNSENNKIDVTSNMLKEDTNKSDEASSVWKVNHYTIHKDNFNTEGEYTVVISSTDQAGNSMMNNTSKYENKKDISFVYDESVPHWNIQNSDDNDVYSGSSYDFKIAANDDISGVNKVRVIYNGNSTEFSAKDIKDGVVTYKAEEAFGTQKMKIEVEDKAGNVSEEPIYEFVLTSNALVRFLYRYWIALIIAGVVIAAGTAGGIVLKKRNKNQ